MELLRKYGVQADIYFPLIDAGVQDFADSSDYTHSSGDVKIIKDGGAAATATNAPSVIATANSGAIWKLTLTSTEMQAALIQIVIVDAATKAIEDQSILIATYGDASAQHAFDLDTSAVTAAAIADAVLDDALTEPAAAFTWAGATLRTIVGWLGALSRNKVLQTSVTSTLRNDADSGSISTSTVSDSGSELIRGEWT